MKGTYKEQTQSLVEPSSYKRAKVLNQHRVQYVPRCIGHIPERAVNVICIKEYATNYTSFRHRYRYRNRLIVAPNKISL
jgi:hypothetical protein